VDTNLQDLFAFAGKAPFRWYLGQWVSFFLVSLVGCLISNALYGLPLAQVANVILSINFSYLIFVLAIWQIAAVLFLVGRRMDAFGAAILWDFAWLLLFFAPVLAFQFYALMTHADIHDSWVYDRFDSVIQHTIGAFFTWTGGLIGTKIGPLGGILLQMGGKAIPALSFASGLVTVLSFFRVRGASAAQHH
jgi:hypothetical protein